MILSCTCNRRVASSHGIPKGQESSNYCKSCGGILSVDELGGLTQRMWNTLGTEYSRVIDPQLKWNISSNVKPRALRRARTFAQDDRKKFIVKNVKDSEDLFDKNSKNGDTLVSESEKLGVSILGRRFSDNLEIVPIKKRRFSLPSSPSPPNLSPSSDFSDQNHGSHLSLFLNNKVSVKQDETCIKSSCRVDWDREGGFVDEKRSLEDMDEQICDSADFSGISILAAAACDSSVQTLVDEKGPGVGGHSSEVNPVLAKVSEPQRDKGCLVSHDHELGEIKPNSSLVATVEALSRESSKLNNEFKRENSDGSLQSSPSKMKSVPCRDDRLHWDLNTVMDSWETQSDELSKSVQRDASIPVAVCDEGNCGLPQTEVCGPIPKDCQYMDAKVTIETTTKMNLAGSVENSCLVVSTDAYAVEGPAKLANDNSTKALDVPKEEKHETDCASFNIKVDTRNNLSHSADCASFNIKVDTHNNLSHSVSPGSANADRSTNDCGPLSEDKKVNETVHDESTSSGTIDSFSDHSAECDPSYVRCGKNNPLKSPNFDGHQSLSTDDIAPGVNTQSPASQVKDTCGMIIHGNNEKAFQVLLDRSNSKNMASEDCLSDEAAYNEEFGNGHAGTNQSECLLSKPQGTYDHLHLPCRGALIQTYGRSTADVKVNENYILSGESSNTNKTDSPVHICSNHTISNSEEMGQDTNCIPSIDDTLNSHEGPGKISLEEQYDSECHSDASPIETDLASGTEKVEFLGDDDSQYEDGELRESVLNSWGEDGAEEVETEHVDYGSETEVFKTGSDFGSQYDLAVGSMECKHEGQLVSTSIDEVSNSKCYRRRSLKKDVSNANYSEGDVGLNILKDSRENHNLNDANEVSARDDNRLLASAISADASDVFGRSCQPERSRMKSSGWDKLPRGEFAAVNWHYKDASLSPSVRGESARRTCFSSIRRDSSSRVERSMSSERSCRKEVFYARESRKYGHIDLNAQRNSDASRSLGRSRLSFGSHGRGRGERWVGSPDHHENSHYDTSNYYSSANFAHATSRNAAAAAVAKVESNGFVVAPDGTIVKAGCMGSGTHLSGRPSKSSSHLQSTRRGSTMEGDGAFGLSSGLSNSREISPDRHFNVGRGRPRYGFGVVSIGQRNRYHGPMPDNRIDSLSMEHPLPKRQRSFSPHKRPTHLSREHTRSPSRSRTRSPHAWASPRGRNDGRINGVSNVMRESRSPQNVKPHRRLLRERSPQRRAIPGEELAGYIPLPRNHSSPLHASRWIDGKRNLQDHLQEHQHRFPTERSPPARIFSQSNRIDHIGSRGRMKPDEYYRPMHSGTFRECAGYGRESKQYGYDDGRRGKSGRYELLHPEGHFENNGNMKCLHFDDGFRTHNPQPNPSGFQRRESLRAFDRGIDAEHGKSPRRIKEEMPHF